MSVARRMRSWPRTLQAAWLAMLCATVGCGGPAPGRLELRSLADTPVRLTADFDTAVYGHDPEDGTSIIVSDVSVERLSAESPVQGQVMHVELLWVPKAGATPMDPTATNASIRHVLFVDGEVGIYGGAGFVVPVDALGAPTLQLEVRQATLTLLESTDGFVDALGAARLAGTITARHDQRGTRRLYFTLCQRVTDALGRSRFVRDERRLDDPPRPKTVAISWRSR